MDVLDVAVFDERRNAVFPCRAQASRIEQSLPDGSVYYPTSGGYALLMVLFVACSIFGGGYYVLGEAGLLSPYILVLPPLASWSAIPTLKLGEALAPKRLAVMRIDLEGQLIAVTPDGETVAGTPTPEYIADYTKAYTIQRRLKPRADTRGKLAKPLS